MFCNGTEKRRYYFVDLKPSSAKKIIHENIFYLPKGNYRSIEQTKWNIDNAPKLFEDLFAISYDKIILNIVNTYDFQRPTYTLSCLLPPEV